MLLLSRPVKSQSVFNTTRSTLILTINRPPTTATKATVELTDELDIDIQSLRQTATSAFTQASLPVVL
jgi:hypothetical protein